MCKLADYGNRFAYIKEADESYLTKLVQYETRRHQTSEQELIIRNENLKYLERSDEENLVSTSLVNFREHLGQLRSNLQTAEEEEEIARKVRVARLSFNTVLTDSYFFNYICFSLQ